MRAKYVNENISYKRGSDPKDSLGISLKTQIYQGMYDLNNIPGVLGMQLRYDLASDIVFLKIKYAGRGDQRWKSKVKEYLGEYVNPDTTPGVSGNYYFPIRPEYIKFFKEIFEEDNKRGVSESVNFERGKDPKSAMGLGQWSRGYKVEYDPYGDKPHPPEMEVIDWADYNWDKGAGAPDDLSETTVTKNIYETLKKLPMIVFKGFDNMVIDGHQYLGLFGDWIEDRAENFEFFDTPFVARVSASRPVRNFLVAPEGFNYARYVTELV